MRPSRRRRGERTWSRGTRTRRSAGAAGLLLRPTPALARTGRRRPAARVPARQWAAAVVVDRRRTAPQAPRPRRGVGGDVGGRGRRDLERLGRRGRRCYGAARLLRRSCRGRRSSPSRLGLSDQRRRYRGGFPAPEDFLLSASRHWRSGQRHHADSRKRPVCTRKPVHRSEWAQAPTVSTIQMYGRSFTTISWNSR